MKNLEGLKLVTRGEREIVMKRELNAPRRLVFHAFTKAGVGEALVTRRDSTKPGIQVKRWVRSSCPK